MTKRESTWLIVKVIGVCLLLYGAKGLFAVLESLLMVTKASNGDVLLTQNSGLISGWLIEAIVSLLAGFYLIKDGSILFEWLNHEPEPESLKEHNSGYLSIKSTEVEDYKT